MEYLTFKELCDDITGRQKELTGIGTLGEKTVHSVLKHYYSPILNHHEVKVGGFVADIFTGKEIIEIQTRNFNALRRKLSVFLDIAPVTIVYPVHNIKWLRWINPQTGEISPPRKSPKRGTPYMVFPELYRIKNYLTNPNLRLKIILLNMEEYRYLDGWSHDQKKGSTRCDRIPTELVSEFSIDGIADYRKLVPDALPEEFTSRDFQKTSGLSLNKAQTALNILHYLQIVERTGKRGNAFLYTKL